MMRAWMGAGFVGHCGRDLEGPFFILASVMSTKCRELHSEFLCASWISACFPRPDRLSVSALVVWVANLDTFAG
jgi:hypothetical protein